MSRDISESNISLYWEIGNNIFTNMDINQVQFRVEMRKYNIKESEEFRQEYEGKK